MPTEDYIIGESEAAQGNALEMRSKARKIGSDNDVADAQRGLGDGHAAFSNDVRAGGRCGPHGSRWRRWVAPGGPRQGRLRRWCGGWDKRLPGPAGGCEEGIGGGGGDGEAVAQQARRRRYHPEQ
eukprot:8041795-Pyramimonas_sp.AAC.1